ncbi:hypothetical protein BDP27DRAFT_1409143, partial [Rhodocollybia butyracea]
MTPEEVAEVSSSGLSFSINMASSILLSTLFGIYSLACFISLYIYFKTKSNVGSAKKAMIYVFLGDLSLMLIYFVLSVAATLELVKYGLVVSLPGGITEQIVAADLGSQIRVYDNICVWLSNAIPLIADTVIVWRAWAVWMDNTKVKWTLLLLMLADIAVCLADTALDTTLSSMTLQSGEDINLDWIAVVLSLSVNMIATCSIAFRA